MRTVEYLAGILHLTDNPALALNNPLYIAEVVAPLKNDRSAR